MSIFNSLGSNYDFGLALQALFAKNKKEDGRDLTKLLEEKYEGKAILTYKGREALRLALRASNLKGATVAICGFTCFAVYEAIVKEGYKVEYLDIEKDDLNFSARTLERAFKKNSNLKIVFIQNTLGYPCDIESIGKFCKENDIVLLEDLAHSIGLRYQNGQEAGTIGDFVMLSFSQDKMIDRVSGGALIVRNSEFRIQNSEFSGIKRQQKQKDEFYPLFTFLIRKTYVLGVGKIFHILFKKLKLLSNPMSYADMGRIHSLPEDYSQSIYQQFQGLEKALSHKKKIAKIYSELLPKNILFDKMCESIDNSSNLRFPIFVEDKISLINFLKKENIFISDTWYDSVIGPQKYFGLTDYQKGGCPNSEIISEKIVNLPTHINVSENDAGFICKKINDWLERQK